MRRARSGISTWWPSGTVRAFARRRAEKQTGSWEVNRTLGRRFLLEPDPIGDGGFAEVFRATDREADLVAVKVLRETAASIRRRSSVSSANFGYSKHSITERDLVIGHGETDDHDIWYAMPLAQGSLTDFVAKFGGQEKLIVDVMSSGLVGLSHVHDQGVYHRDLKPATSYACPTATGRSLTFGLAVEAERGTSPLTSLTLRTGLGSWVYAAPEQWARARSADHRSDIYSLGKILQELVTQDYPVNTEIPPGPLRSVIETAIANSPDARYQSVSSSGKHLSGRCKPTRSTPHTSP